MTAGDYHPPQRSDGRTDLSVPASFHQLQFPMSSIVAAVFMLVASATALQIGTIRTPARALVRSSALVMSEMSPPDEPRPATAPRSSDTKMAVDDIFFYRDEVDSLVTECCVTCWLAEDDVRGKYICAQDADLKDDDVRPDDSW